MTLEQTPLINEAEPTGFPLFSCQSVMNIVPATEGLTPSLIWILMWIKQVLQLVKVLKTSHTGQRGRDGRS